MWGKQPKQVWLDGSLPCGHANKYSADWKLVSRVETWKCAVRLGFCRDGKAHIQIYVGLSGSPPPPLPPPNCVLLSVAPKRASFFSSTNEDTGYTPHGVVRVADFDSKNFFCVFVVFHSPRQLMLLLWIKWWGRKHKRFSSGRIFRLLENRASHLR